LEGNTITEKAIRNFALEIRRATRMGSLQGNRPDRQALEAANRGITDIRLREWGRKKMHLFTGERKQVKNPASAPA
jgi:hypothetical protein